MPAFNKELVKSSVISVLLRAVVDGELTCLTLDGNKVLDGPQPVHDVVLDLPERVLVGALHQDGHLLRAGAIHHERVLVLAQHVLVHQAGLRANINLRGKQIRTIVLNKS